MFYSCKSQFREKNPVLPIEKFSFLAQARNMIILQHLTIHFLLHQPSGGHLREVKNKGKFKLLALKVVAYERWPLTRGGRLQEVAAYERWLLTRGGCLREVVAYERWSPREVQLYTCFHTWNKGYSGEVHVD